MPCYALFDSAEKARHWQRQYGGWVAVDQNRDWHWWAPSWTPSKIMTGKMWRGLSLRFD